MFELAVDVEQAQPIASFLRFSAADLDFHHEILLPDRFVCFDVICADRTRRANELLGIFYVSDSSRQSFNKRATPFRKNSGAFF